MGYVPLKRFPSRVSLIVAFRYLDRGSNLGDPSLQSWETGTPYRSGYTVNIVDPNRRAAFQRDGKKEGCGIVVRLAPSHDAHCFTTHMVAYGDCHHYPLWDRPPRLLGGKRRA